MRNVLVVQGSLTLVDELRAVVHTPLRLTVAQGTLSTEVAGRHARLQVSGEIPQGGGAAAFSWDGSLTQRGERGHLQAEGVLRLQHVNVRHLLSFWNGPGRITDGVDGAAQMTAHVRWSSASEGHDVLVDELKAELQELAIQGSGSITGLGGPRPKFAALLSAPPVPLPRALRQVPSAWLDEPLRVQLDGYGVDGLLALRSMAVSGTLGAEGRPNVSAVVEIRNGRFAPAPPLPAVEHIYGTVIADAEQLRMREMRAEWGAVRLTGQDLLVTRWTTDPRVDVKVQGTAPLAGVVETARRLDQFPLLRDLAAQVEGPTGQLDMVVHLTGQPASGKPLELTDLDLKVRQGGVRSAWLPVPVRQVEAHVTVTPTLVAIDHLEGWAGPAAFRTHGEVALVGGKAFSDVTLNMHAEAAALDSLWPEGGEGAFRPEVEGALRLHAAVTGPFDRLRIKGLFDLRQAALHIPNRLTKPLQAPASVGFDMLLSGGTGLAVRQFDLRFPPIKLVGEGALEFSEEKPFSLKLSTGKLAVDRLPKGVALGPIRAGTLDAVLKMTGQLSDRRSWQTVGHVRFDEGRLAVERLAAPIRDLFVTLRFDQDRIQIPRLAFHVGASDVRVTGSVAQWAEAPKVRLTVESSQFDVTSLALAPSSPSRAGRRSTIGQRPTMEQEWWSAARVDAFLFVDHLYYKTFLLTDLSTRVVWDHGLLTVERISGDTNDGHVAGQAKVRMDGRQQPERVGSTFRANGIPIDRVLSEIQQHPSLSGWLTTSGKLQAEFERGVLLPGAIASRQPIHVLVEDGRLSNLPVLSTLLSVLNLPALLQGQVDLEKDGLPFDHLKLVGSLNQGVVVVKELLLDSPILKISGTGRYDMLADEFDMILVTSPLGSYSNLLKRVPLFQQLLAGDRQGFDTAVFELKGSANKPELRYLAAESLMAGVKGTAQLAFDVLVNAIKLPQQAYAMVEESFGAAEEEDF